MILTTYKYIVNSYRVSSFLIIKNDGNSNFTTLFIEYFSFNYFSLTKLFYGMHIGMSNRFLPMKILKIRV